ELAAIKRLTDAVDGHPLHLHQSAALAREDRLSFENLARTAERDPEELDRLSINGLAGQERRALAFLALAAGVLEAICGKRRGLWYAFGAHDGYALAEVPDNTAAGSTLLTPTGSGKFRSLSTMVLLTVEETLDALRRAQAGQFQPAP